MCNMELDIDINVQKEKIASSTVNPHVCDERIFPRTFDLSSVLLSFQYVHIQSGARF